VIADIAIAALLLAATFFHAVAALGVVRMPDFYTRMHAVSKAETLGMLFTLAALVVFAGLSLVTVKLVFLAVFLFLANPTSTHAIGRAALRVGLPPWRRPPPEDA
jgi:multicomponent Na+:H+ antiporter subunit G